MNATLALFSATVVSAASLAIPEGYYLRTGELEAILKSASVKQVVQRQGTPGSSGVIDVIRYTGPGANGVSRYRIDSGSCHLTAEAKRVSQPGVVGPGAIVLTHSQRLQCAED